MKKVLIITYYWPPSGGGGVQRVLKMVKYLRSFGWEPVVYTAKDAAYPVLDESLRKDVPEGQTVLEGDIWEPYEAYKKFTGQGKKERVYSGFMNEKPSFTQRASVWIRGNVFIPDARAFWIKPSIKFLSRWLKENPVDAIISTGPPHSVHLIAKGLKRKMGTPWIADFRDPWTNIDFYDQLKLTSWADAKHHRLEKSVIKEADKMVTVSWHWAEEFAEMGRKDIEVITNGFDHADFEGKETQPDPAFTICHIGYLNRDRNNRLLWESLSELAEELPAFREQLRLRFIGKTDEITFAELEELGLGDQTERVDYVPHDEVIDALGKAQVLMLLTNDTPNVMGIIPGKLFEYLAAQRPILGIGAPEGDSGRILAETSAGVMCGFSDKAKMKATVRLFFEHYQAGTLAEMASKEAIDRFTRKSATGKMAQLLDQITG